MCGTCYCQPEASAQLMSLLACTSNLVPCMQRIGALIGHKAGGLGELPLLLRVSGIPVFFAGRVYHTALRMQGCAPHDTHAMLRCTCKAALSCVRVKRCGMNVACPYSCHATLFKQSCPVHQRVCLFTGCKAGQLSLQRLLPWSLTHANFHPSKA